MKRRIRKYTNEQAVAALDAAVDRLTSRALDMCDPANWPTMEAESPEMTRRLQDVSDEGQAKAAAAIVKLLGQLSNIADNRRRTLTPKNLNQPHREGKTPVDDIVADAEARAQAAVDAARNGQVH